MKTIILPIRPKWVEKILNGDKTIEVRKFALEKPFKVLIYCTKCGATKNCHIDSNGRKNLLIDYCWDSILDERQTISSDLKGRRQLGKHSTHCFNYGTVLNGKVVGEFVCNKIISLKNDALTPVGLQAACLTEEQILNYGKGKTLYGWHISDLKVYDKPRELSEYGIARAPQNYCYVQEEV